LVTEAETLEFLGRAGAATVYEAAGRRGDVDPVIRAATTGLSVAGRAFTVDCEIGDNLALHRAVAEAEAGSVLVVDGHEGEFGYLGDVLAEAAAARGILGVVINGYCRDVTELRKMRFPVWSRGLAIRGATKTKPGKLRTILDFGGVRIAPGDVIIADDDGICAVGNTDLANVVVATQRRLAQEVTMRERLREGALTLDLLDLRKYLPDTAARNAPQDVR
jgi:4-hydroxy-4-methyl-2-oxoglutarate aldolase